MSTVTEEKRKPGRPPMGDQAKTYPLRMRLTRETGSALELIAENAGISPAEMARNIIVRAVRRKTK